MRIFTFGHQFPVRFLHPLFLPALKNDLRAQVKYLGSFSLIEERADELGVKGETEPGSYPKVVK
jgi:hypothetical protein